MPRYGGSLGSPLPKLFLSILNWLLEIELIDLLVIGLSVIS